MYKTRIKSYLGSYTFEFKSGILTTLDDLLIDGDTIIIDEKVYKPHSKELENISGKIKIIKLKATETQKSYIGLFSVINQLIEAGFRRENRLLAIGGGIIQDSTAFIASILYRGVKWLFIPTTLLAQGDSCIGSKTSVNFEKYKNQLGGFYPPTKIIIDASLLKTLDSKDIKSGIGEMCHYFLIEGKKSFCFFKSRINGLLNLDENCLIDTIRHSLSIKRKMIQKDEFDKGPRQVFNYGHSFGHAIESLTDYQVPHGIAVAIGMDMANYVSEHLGLVKEPFRDEVRSVLKDIWHGFDLSKINIVNYINALKKDKKNIGNDLGLILSSGYGKMKKIRVEITPDFTDWITLYMKNFS